MACYKEIKGDDYRHHRIFRQKKGGDSDNFS